MYSKSFTHFFWISYLPLFVVLLVLLHFSWRHEYKKLPKKVSFPVLGSSYVAIYALGENPANIDYEVFTTGIFGFSDRMSQADIILFGSSHIQFGLSAELLGQKLSAAKGHPVKVFNAAITGTSLSMIADEVTANHLQNKEVIFDLFALDQPPFGKAFGFTVLGLSSDQFKAYFSVGKSWMDFSRDWFLDGIFPNLRIGNPIGQKIVSEERCLKFTMIRDWNNGDLVQFWMPVQGTLYPKSDIGTPIDNTNHLYNESPNHAVGRQLNNDIIKAQNLKIVYMLMPFDGSFLGVVPPNAKPFIDIPTDGLIYLDGSHLTSVGRLAATQKLFEGLQKLDAQK